MALKFTQTVDLGANRIVSLGEPTGPQDAVTKNYVDTFAQGISWKQSVRAASTANINLASAPAAVDGVTLAADDRVLVKDQTAPAENGIYVFSAAAAAMVRADDADDTASLTAGSALTVEEGTANADQSFVLVTNAPIVVGTTAITYTLLQGAKSTYTAGDGIDITSGVVSVAAGLGIDPQPGALNIDTAVVPRKFLQLIGDGAATDIVVTHSLNNIGVQVEVFTGTAPYDTVFAEVQRVDADNVQISFGAAPANNEYAVSIIG